MKRWAGAAIATLLLVGLATWGALTALGALSPPVPSVRGLRLGMTFREVRERVPGTFETHAGPSGDVIAAQPGVELHFHDGALVLIDAVLPPTDRDAVGDPRTIRPATVLAREPSPDGRVRVRLVSRTCPTHAALAEDLLAPR